MTYLPFSPDLKIKIFLIIFALLVVVSSCDDRKRRGRPSVNVVQPTEDLAELAELEADMHELDREVARMTERYPDAYYEFPPAGQQPGLDRSPEAIDDYDPNKQFDPHLERTAEDIPREDRATDEENLYSIRGITEVEDRKKLEVTLEKIRVNREKLRGRPDTHGVYYIVDTDPQPEEGFAQFRQEIARNMRIPHQAVEDGIEGEVLFSFVVNTEGEIENVEVVEENFNVTPEGDYLQEMYNQVINGIMETSGRWEPGLYQGEQVATRYYLPIRFDAAEGVISAREHVH